MFMGVGRHNNAAWRCMLTVLWYLGWEGVLKG
jgi:hypothetical protein